MAIAMSEAQLFAFHSTINRDRTPLQGFPAKGRQKVRERLQVDVDAFLANGGQVQELPPPKYSSPKRALNELFHSYL